MQFHFDGFMPGDPAVAPATAKPDGHLGGPDGVDVVIVGCGPAGLTLAAQLAAFPDIRTKIIDAKPGPLRLGQADGIACRTVEMFEAFGFSERVLKEAYWVNETVFWKPDSADRSRIVRSERIRDTEEDLSEFPHLILNQARVHDFYLEKMANAPSRLRPDYSRQFVGVTRSDGTSAHPLAVQLQRAGSGDQDALETISARFLVGCDGARSAVRGALGKPLRGDSANKAWGVMDVLADTDFPDIRLKSIIHSSAGNILIIPREGGYLVRLYIELDALAADERITNRNISVNDLVGAAKRILLPYAFDVRDVAWWSVYEIGQRLCDTFDDADEHAGAMPRIFIAGDACHTHSPKAGQGMNVSMQDSFNLGWKLAAVLRGRARADILRTYSAERRAVAAELIDFDRTLARMFSLPPADPAFPERESVDPAEFNRYFVRQGRFTAGVETRYGRSMLVGDATYQSLAPGFAVGARFHSAPVIRHADARPVDLGHVVKADGRWRLFLFAERDEDRPVPTRLHALCAFLADEPASPVRAYTPDNADLDSVIDVRCILQQHHRRVTLGALPDLLYPRRGRFRLRDYEKLFCPDIDGGRDVFDMRAIDRARGCMVIIRPDQHVAHVLPLDGTAELVAFFEDFMLPARSRSE